MKSDDFESPLRNPESVVRGDYEKDDWADRCRYWQWQFQLFETRRKRRERRSNPLILTGHGLSIRVDKGCLLITDGRTHCPSPSKQFRFFQGGLDNPPRIVALDGSGNVSLDALGWMAEQSIAFVRISYDGVHTAAFSPNGYTADNALTAWQRDTRDNPAKRLTFAKDLIARKLTASLETMESHLPPSMQRTRSIEAVRVCARDLVQACDIPVLLSIEGKAAQNYWRAWQTVEMRWKAQTRYPVPDEWKTFKARSSVLSGQKWKNWKASHPINAMLNYAYAVLLTDMRTKGIADGYDPMMGILHDQRHYAKERTPSFALDLMEPLRPVVDRVVLRLVREETFSGADFVLQSDGVCRLNPELTRALGRSVSCGRVWNDC